MKLFTYFKIALMKINLKFCTIHVNLIRIMNFSFLVFDCFAIFQPILQAIWHFRVVDLT